MLGEVGLGSVKDGATARQDGCVGAEAWHSKHDPYRRPSIPGSSLIDKDIVLAADADVIGHINGGHTALPDDQVVALWRAIAARSRDCSQRQRKSGLVNFADRREN